MPECRVIDTWLKKEDSRILAHINGRSTDSAAQVVSGTQLCSELAQIAIETVTCGAHTVTFQPRTQYPIEDRHLVEDWKLSNGIEWDLEIYWDIWWFSFKTYLNN